MHLVEAVEIICDARTNEVAIATMSAMTALAEISRSDFDLCYFSPMGTASSVGLGLALARPDLKVMVLDGDGSLLMNLGSLVTIGNLAPDNFIHFVFKNGVYGLSGMQSIPSRGTANLCDMARAAGIRNVWEISSASAFVAAIAEIISGPGPTFVDLEVEAEPTPYLDRMGTPAQRDRTAREGWHGLHELLRRAVRVND
jgi:phosphonopyruvate decarboxylase